MNPRAVVNVAMTSDLMCPWCWVGLRKLQEASKNTNIETVITWKPYLLRPNIPIEGVPKADPTPASRVGQHLKIAGKHVGIDFTGLTDRTPNTVLFHAIMEYLQHDLELDPKLVTTFHEAVFEGYFTLGEFPDERGFLAAARRVDQQYGDLNLQQSITALLQDSPKLMSLQKLALAEARAASRRGVSSVPTFEMNGEPVFSGAQPVATFEAALKEFAEK